MQTNNITPNVSFNGAVPVLNRSSGNRTTSGVELNSGITLCCFVGFGAISIDAVSTPRRTVSTNSSSSNDPAAQVKHTHTNVPSTIDESKETSLLLLTFGVNCFFVVVVDFKSDSPTQKRPRSRHSESKEKVCIVFHIWN
jgi:hypothetical protein